MKLPNWRSLTPKVEDSISISLDGLLQPLLQEYIHGMYDEEGLMNRFAKAYGYQKPVEGDVNETTQDQG